MPDSSHPNDFQLGPSSRSATGCSTRSGVRPGSILATLGVDEAATTGL